ncbi:MAG: hypothetical protein H6741_18935 [Alphaproteobacteria bacterium]|nr:hypothetical protein [Alphaproteobacteria bacterium]
MRSSSYLRLVRDEPCFGALDEDDGPLREITLDEDTSPRRKSRANRLLRLQTRAALFASPTTPCSAQEVANVLGMRDSDIRALQPAGLRRYGRSLKAPFDEWIAALHADAATEPAPRRRQRPTSRRLQALGGPKRR